ncbi:cupin domain-containing protein [Granulicella sibirica]|uniref:Cupin 2 conserved barrel domain protein n=1 Tax=Granulicella sibirica TaxID=2479048 RepID=A0A4Q0T1T2_9BACT|nr:cupin domain-containing protein [Granulicella sibirica]RXH56762.1 Cupin 2 conserved barrel domain protein [Granulicella sibirica]
MSSLNRRDLVAALAALTVTRSTAEAQAIVPPGETVLATPKVFSYEDLPVKKNPNRSETRPVLQGTLPTGEAIELHETVLAVGGTPNPPHQHRQSDIILIRKGTIAFEHDGKAEHAGPGAVIFVGSETMHTVRNVGEEPAEYFVIVIGREAQKQLV